MTKPSRCSHDHHVRPRAHDARRFTQHQLDQPRVLADLGAPVRPPRPTARPWQVDACGPRPWRRSSARRPARRRSCSRDRRRASAPATIRAARSSPALHHRHAGQRDSSQLPGSHARFIRTRMRQRARSLAAPARHRAAGTAPGPGRARGTPDGGSPGRYTGRIFSTCSSGSVETIQRLAARSTGSASASRSISIGSSTDIFSSGVSASAAQCRVSSQGALAVGVERDLHLDHPVESLRVGLAGELRGLRRRSAAASRCRASHSLPLVQMKPSPTRPAYFATCGPAAAT